MFGAWWGERAVREFRIGLLGGTSLVGKCLWPLLRDAGCHVTAFTRGTCPASSSAVVWRDVGNWRGLKLDAVVSLIPVWALSAYREQLAATGARRIVALSSTSRFTKDASSDTVELAIAKRLKEGEEQLQSWSEEREIEWVVLRPTLIYGYGRDKNIAEIAHFIRRFGFFPLLGNAVGLRQPLHAEDVAIACMAALQAPGAANRAYNLSGGETLPYRDMVTRVFTTLHRPLRLLPVPLPAVRVAVALLRCLPRYRHWSAAMAERMNRDLVFDYSDATRDLGFLPRPFTLAPRDLPIS